MPTLSTHVLDGAAGRARAGVVVEVHDERGSLVGRGETDAGGRIENLAVDVPPGRYLVAWHLGGFVSLLSAWLDLSEERPYHVPVLASGHSAVVYLGA